MIRVKIDSDLNCEKMNPTLQVNHRTLLNK